MFAFDGTNVSVKLNHILGIKNIKGNNNIKCGCSLPSWNSSSARQNSGVDFLILRHFWELATPLVVLCHWKTHLQEHLKVPIIPRPLANQSEHLITINLKPILLIIFNVGFIFMPPTTFEEKTFFTSLYMWHSSEKLSCNPTLVEKCK